MADSFASGAVSGATTVQGMPRLRAHHATPCAMFPAEAVRTPRANRDSGMAAIALAAPRLEILELEPDIRRRRRKVEAHERRAQGDSSQAIAGRADVVEARHHGHPP